MELGLRKRHQVSHRPMVASVAWERRVGCEAKGPSMTRTSVVTGGAGFIGSNLVHALLARGDRVRVFDDLSTGRGVNLDDVGSDVELVHGDVRDADAVALAVEGAAVVFHQAAIPSVARSVADPVSSNDVNVGGTLNVLVAARDAGGGASRLRVLRGRVRERRHAAPARGDADPRPRRRTGSPSSRGSATSRRSRGRTRCRPSRCATSTCSARARTPARSTRRRSRGSSRARSAARRRRSSVTASRRATSCSSTMSCGPTCWRPTRRRPAWGRAFNVGRGERRTVNELLARDPGLSFPACTRRRSTLRHEPARFATAGAPSARRAMRSATTRPSGSRRAWVERSTGSRRNEPRTCGNVGRIADARVSELADDSDLKSLALRSVWVRVPPRAPGSSPLPSSPTSSSEPSGFGAVRPIEGEGEDPSPRPSSARLVHGSDQGVTRCPRT